MAEQFSLDEEQPPVSPSMAPQRNPAVPPPAPAPAPASLPRPKPIVATAATARAAAAPVNDREPPLLIGVAGGTASGKTTLTRTVISKLHEDQVIDRCKVVMISQDSFYKPLNAEQRAIAHENKYNFDTPDAFDFPLLLATLKKLLNHEPVDIPTYDFVTHARTGQTTRIVGAEVVVLEGILVLHDPDIVRLMSMKIFVDADPDVRLARRVTRDIAERGRELHGVLQQYLTFVKPAYDRFIAPTKNFADIVIQKGGENMVAVNLICGHIREALEARRHASAAALAGSLSTSVPLGSSLPRAGMPHVQTTRSSSPINTLGVSPVLLNLAAR